MQSWRPILTALATTATLAGCAADTTFSAVDSTTSIRVRDATHAPLPASTRLKTTSFGNYQFEARQEGRPPFYGILPLKFNGGYLALDILFFAPGTFFNLREVFPQYEIDVEKQVLRYRKDAGDAWVEYAPTPQEAERARRFFESAP
jgi:hypothetical protein